MANDTVDLWALDEVHFQQQDVSNSLVATLATRAENGGLHRVMRAEKCHHLRS